MFPANSKVQRTVTKGTITYEVRTWIEDDVVLVRIIEKATGKMLDFRSSADIFVLSDLRKLQGESALEGLIDLAEEYIEKNC